MHKSVKNLNPILIFLWINFVINHIRIEHLLNNIFV